jgi:hypothetical protein
MISRVPIPSSLAGTENASVGELAEPHVESWFGCCLESFRSQQEIA